MVHTTVVSSPGKVLIAGGYLVLDPTYSGTVVSTSSRFYTTVQDDLSKTLRRIRVRSPQFIDAEWEYIVSFEQAYLSVEPTSASSVVFLVATHLSISLIQDD
jgi:phosphomevalonate kinase